MTVVQSGDNHGDLSKQTDLQLQLGRSLGPDLLMVRLVLDRKFNSRSCSYPRDIQFTAWHSDSRSDRSDGRSPGFADSYPAGVFLEVTSCVRRCNQLNVGILLYEGILATSQFESD